MLALKASEARSNRYGFLSKLYNQRHTIGVTLIALTGHYGVRTVLVLSEVLQKSKQQLSQLVTR